MKPDIRGNDDDEREASLSNEALEAALRRLPAVNVPRGLEAKLIAAMPRPVAEIKSKHEPAAYLRLAAVGVAAAAVAAAVLLSILKPQSKDGPELVSAQAEAPAISVTMVEFKETDPCNILPPLANWQ